MGVVLNWNVVIAFLAGVFVLFVLLKVFSKPFEIILKMLINVIMGGACLLLFNLLGDFFGFTIAVNVVNAFIVGFLGVPGFVLLVLLKLFLKI